MHLEVIPWVSIPGQILMQVFVAVAMVYMLYRHRRDTLAVLLILLCCPRVFLFFGSTMGNVYKVVMLLLCGYVLVQQRAAVAYQRKDGWILLLFALFSAEFFWTAAYYTKNTLTIIFSQYSRYVEAVLLYFIIKKAIIIDGKGDSCCGCCMR